jgi:hypothetical protein
VSDGKHHQLRLAHVTCSPLMGGCLCGAVRYRLDSKPFDAGYCHCRICQRASGAAFLAFATVPVADFNVTQGRIANYRSSDLGSRGRCKDCGTQLTIQVDFQPETIDFSIASLDLPELVIPTFHIWWKSRIQWTTVDSLPKFLEFRPDTRGLPQARKSGRTN